MKLTVVILLLFCSFRSFAEAQIDIYGFNVEGNLLEQLRDEVELAPRAGTNYQMARMLMNSSFNSVISTDVPCSDTTEQFSSKLYLSIEPTKVCHQQNSAGWTDRDEFCSCMAENSLGMIDPEKYNEILGKIIEEAKKKQNYYVNTTFQLLKDKVLSNIEAMNKYGRSANLTCGPSTLISNFNKATKECSSESLSKIEEMTNQKDVFNLLDDNFRALNNEFKAKTYNNREFENITSELAALLKTVYRHNQKTELIPSEKISEVDNKLKSLLNQNPLLRKFQVKISTGNSGQYTFNNPMANLLNVIEKPDLFEEMEKSQYGSLRENLSIEIGNENSKSILQLNDIEKNLKAVIDHEVSQQNQFCAEIKVTVKHICQSATSINPTIKSIQKDPMHMAKIVNEVLGERIYGTELNNKKHDYNSPINLDYDPELMGLYRPNIPSAEELNEEYSSRKMIDVVSSLQCTFVLPKMLNDFVPGILLAPAQNKNLQRFSDIGNSYGAFNSQFLGRIADTDPSMLLDSFQNYDPYGFMNSATNWSKDLAKVAREENNIKTKDNVGFTPIYDWRSQSTITSASKPDDTNLSPAAGVGTGGKTVSDINELRERAGQNATSNDEETEAEINNTPVLETPSVGITNLPQVGLPTTTQKAAQSSAEGISKEIPTPEANPLADYEMRMQEMMAQMAVLTAKSAQLAKQSKADKEDEEIDEEKDELKQTIAGLQAEIDDLAKKKKEVSKVTKQESKPTTIGITPFQSVNQSAPAKSSSQKAVAANKQAVATGASRSSTPMASSQSSVSAPTMSSLGGSKGFSSQSSSKSDFALNAESVNLEGKFTISAKDFKTSDQKIMSDLYKKANGQPIYVTEKLPDGTEEVVMYEAVKEEDGTIKYVPKKIKDLVPLEKAAKKKSKAKTKKENEAKKRKRTKVEDLNKLIDQNKQ